MRGKSKTKAAGKMLRKRSWEDAAGKRCGTLPQWEDQLEVACTTSKTSQRTGALGEVWRRCASRLGVWIPRDSRGWIDSLLVRVEVQTSYKLVCMNPQTKSKSAMGTFDRPREPSTMTSG